MPRIAYVNGQYVPLSAAAVHIEDRGFQFADSVYDALAVRDGKFLDEHPHLERLERSLREIACDMPMSIKTMTLVIRQLVARNRIKDGFVYIQVTRGVASRDHAFPTTPVEPTLVMTAKPVSLAKSRAMFDQGISVITQEDLRWQRCDIKSVGLLPNVLAKQAARAAGAYEAWLVDENGMVREGASSNAWIVTEEGILITRPVDHHILSGITRSTLLKVVSNLNIPFEERGFSVEEAKDAREAFNSSAGAMVLPVVQIDGQPVGDGKPGEIARKLQQGYFTILS